MNIHPVADAHVDLVTYLLGQSPPAPLSSMTSGHLTPEGLRAGAVRLMVCTFYCADRFNGQGTAKGRLMELLSAMASMSAPLVPAFSCQALEQTFRDEAAPPGYCHLVENSDALLETDINWLMQRGVRIAGLTHVGSNRLADGNAVNSPGGLRAEGRALLRDLDQAGWAVDLAHLSEPGFWEVLERFTGPIFDSHTGLRAFLDKPRNLTDDQAAAIIERGGLVCLTFAPEILSPDNRASLDTVVAHIDHLAQRHGADNLAIGSDFGGFFDVCQGLEDCSRFQNLGQSLTGRGYGEEVVAGIMGGNLLRFLTPLYPE